MEIRTIQEIWLRDWRQNLRTPEGFSFESGFGLYEDTLSSFQQYVQQYSIMCDKLNVVLVDRYRDESHGAIWQQKNHNIGFRIDTIL